MNETAPTTNPQETQAPQAITGELYGDNQRQMFRDGDNGQFMSRKDVAAVWQNQLDSANESAGIKDSVLRSDDHENEDVEKHDALTEKPVLYDQDKDVDVVPVKKPVLYDYEKESKDDEPVATDATADKPAMSERSKEALDKLRAARQEKKAEQASKSESTRPIDPLMAAKFDAEQAAKATDYSKLSDTELNDLLLSEDIINNPKAFHAAGAESAKREDAKKEAEVQRIFAELDQDIATAKATETAEPSLGTKDRVIRSYVNAEGKPLGGFEELYHELAVKVASGDESDWDDLVATLRDAVKHDARIQMRNSGSVEEHLALFEDYASRKLKELRGNKDTSVVIPPIAQLTPDTTTQLGTIIETTEAAPEPEQKRRKGLLALAAGALIVTGLFGLGAKKALDHDGSSVKAGASIEQTTDTNPVLPGTEKVYGPAYNASTIGEADSGSAEHVFTVDAPYTEGSQTAWSWAESLGVTDVPGFLKEVMGDDYQDIAKHMKVGATISVTNEEIAQFTK